MSVYLHALLIIMHCYEKAQIKIWFLNIVNVYYDQIKVSQKIKKQRTIFAGNV